VLPACVEQSELSLAQRRATRLAGDDRSVKRAHQLRRGVVFDAPEALDKRRCSSVEKATTEADQLVATGHESLAGSAATERNERAIQVEIEYVDWTQLSISQLEMGERWIVQARFSMSRQVDHAVPLRFSHKSFARRGRLDEAGAWQDASDRFGFGDGARQPSAGAVGDDERAVSDSGVGAPRSI